MDIRIGGVYCISEAYFERFQDCAWIMRNHAEGRDDGLGYRPYVLALAEPRIEGGYWAVPLAHDVAKYRAAYDRKVERLGYCDNIYFARIKGENFSSAILAQNMIPVRACYIEKPYCRVATGKTRAFPRRQEEKVLSMAASTLAKHRRGVRTIFPPVDAICGTLARDSAIERGVCALKDFPPICDSILVKETSSDKMTAGIVGAKGSLADLKLVIVVEPKDDVRGARRSAETPISDPRFAQAIARLSEAPWTGAIPRKEELFARVEPAIEQSAAAPCGLGAMLDRAEASAEREASAQADAPEHERGRGTSR